MTEIRPKKPIMPTITPGSSSMVSLNKLQKPYEERVAKTNQFKPPVMPQVQGIGSYKGTTINPGTNVQVADQMKAIDTPATITPPPTTGTTPPTPVTEKKETLEETAARKESARRNALVSSPYAREKKQAQEAVNTLNESAMKEKLRNRKIERSIEKNIQGAGAAGITARIADESRKSAQALADYALAAGVPADRLAQIEEQEKQYQPTQVGNSLVRLNPETGKYEEVYKAPDKAEGYQTVGKDSMLFDPTTGKFITPPGYGETGIGGASSWAALVNSGRAKLSDVPADIRKSTEFANKLAEQKPEMSETSTTALRLVNQLLNSNTDAITGAQGLGVITPGSPEQMTINTYNQLKSLLSLENRQLLKGSGAISDYEFRVLEKASSRLGRNLSNEDFKQVLLDMQTELQNAPVEISGTAQTLEDYVSQNPDQYPAIEKMILENPDLTDDDILQIISGNFNQVGGDTNKATQIANAIKQVESQGNYNAKGGSGEFGAYQFMPGTWKQWAGEILGNPNAQPTPENQDRVAIAKVDSWVKQGYTPQQIALLWNSGTTTPRKGVNKYGVEYDSGAYAKKVLKAIYS